MKSNLIKMNLLALLAGSLFSCSQSDFTEVVTTKPGSLSKILTSEQTSNLKKLAISGPINEADILFIKALDFNGLVSLDLSKAEKLDIFKSYFDSNLLSEITLPDNVSHISNETFRNCKNLEKLNISTNNKHFISIGGILYTKDTSRIVVYPAKLKDTTYKLPSNVKELSYCIFANADSLRSIEVENGNAHFFAEDGILYDRTRKTLIAYPANKKDSIFKINKDINKIERSAFWGNRHIKAYEVDSGNDFFVSYEGLLCKKKQDKSINLTSFPAGRNSSKTVLPDGISSIAANAFHSCSIDTLVLNKELYDIAKSAFNHAQIKQIETTDSSNFTLKNNVIYKGGLILTNSKGDTSTCRIKKSFAIDERALQYAQYKSITFEPALEIGHFACSFCKELQKATLEEGFNNINATGFFLCCPNLKEADLPSSIKNIGNKMFYGCFKLNKLICRAQNPPLVNLDAFIGVNLAKCTLYVPSKSIEAYRKDVFWKSFKNIKPILE